MIAVHNFLQPYVPVELPRPQLPAVADAEQARRHADALGTPLDIAIRHPLNIQLVPRRLWVLLQRAVPAHGADWAHDNIPAVAEFGNQRLGNSHFQRGSAEMLWLGLFSST